MKMAAAYVGALVAGFLVTAVGSTATDAALRALGVFPAAPQILSDPQFALAAAYRALFTVAGGYATVSLAPAHPMRLAWISAGIGLTLGLIGLAVYFSFGGAALGPAWYAIAIPLEAIPCVWLGARLAMAHRAHRGRA